jgi:MoaA/NifB/PqqE/SkfB family radical SAM enzyme
MADQKEIPYDQKYPLKMVYFYLTNDCNLRCRHCWISPRYNSGPVSLSSLPFDLYKKIIKEAKPLGLNAVKLTGGEPLLHPQISDIIDFTLQEDIITEEIITEESPEVNETVPVEIILEDIHKEDFDKAVQEYGLDKALEALNRLKVVKLRSLAREYADFKIAGRLISKADKKVLLDEFKNYYSK